jgi:ribosomal protein L37E
MGSGAFGLIHHGEVTSVICSSCGHKNLNENAPYCGHCGKPLRTAAPEAEDGQTGKGQFSGTTPHSAQRASKKAVAIAILIVIAAVTGLVIVHRSRTNITTPEGSASTATNSSTPAAPPDQAPQPESTPPPPAPQPDSASSASAPAFTPGRNRAARTTSMKSVVAISEVEKD